jgi:hypothetical protein
VSAVANPLDTMAGAARATGSAREASDRASSRSADATSKSDGFVPSGLGFGLFNPNDPVQAGLALITLVLAGAAIAFFGSIVVAAFRARRSLQL